MRELYRAKGYSDEWIARRERGIAVRDTLTDEWKKRGIKEGKEYAILTAEISKATFGITPSQHKKIKSLDRPSENLRDHMTDLELLFTALGEASTTEIAKTHDVYGMTQNVSAAQPEAKSQVMHAQPWKLKQDVMLFLLLTIKICLKPKCVSLLKLILMRKNNQTPIFF